jgi:hypothetical protein
MDDQQSAAQGVLVKMTDEASSPSAISVATLRRRRLFPTAEKACSVR